MLSSSALGQCGYRLETTAKLIAAGDAVDSAGFDGSELVRHVNKAPN
jgi:hypothetical protein